jgi:hypothetical protein
MGRYVANAVEFQFSFVRNPLAADIQCPKLPSRLTESLAIYLLRSGMISGLKQ